MVARHTTSMTRTIFQSRVNGLGIRPRVVLELDSWETMKEAVAAGIGFGIALEDEFHPDNRLVGIPVDGVDLTAGQYFVCLPEFKYLRAVQAFLRLVQEVKEMRMGRDGEPDCSLDATRLSMNDGTGRNQFTPAPD